MLPLEVEALERAGHEVVTVVPEKQRSAAGLARTYHKPLRLRRNGRLFVTNGYPADAVFIALKLLAKDADVVVSGINAGENIGFESTYGSGTVAAAIQAGLLGYKGVAVSMEEGAEEPLAIATLRTAVEAAGRAWDEGLMAISINVPKGWRGEVAAPERISLNSHDEELRAGEDPRGEALYWRWGPRRRPEPETDAYYFYIERAITIIGICAGRICAPARLQAAFQELLADELRARRGSVSRGI